MEAELLLDGCDYIHDGRRRISTQRQLLGDQAVQVLLAERCCAGPTVAVKHGEIAALHRLVQGGRRGAANGIDAADTHQHVLHVPGDTCTHHQSLLVGTTHGCWPPSKCDGTGYVRASPRSGEAAVQTRQVLWAGLLCTGRCPRHASTRPSASTHTSSSPLSAANTNAGAVMGMHIWAGRTYGAIGCGVLTAAFVLLAVAVGARHYDCGCMTQQPPSLGRMSCSRVLLYCYTMASEPSGHPRRIVAGWR